MVLSTLLTLAIAQATETTPPAPPPPPVPPTVIVQPAALPPPPPSAWTGLAGISLISLTGNSQALTFLTTAAAERKSTDWIFGGKFTAAYGQSRAAGTRNSEVVAANASGLLRVDRRFTNRVSSYVAAGASTDHVRNVEYSVFGEGGATFIWFDVREVDYEKTFLRTDLAMRYAHDARFQYYPVPLDQPDVDFLAPRVGVLYRYAINKGIVFQEEAEVLPNVLGAFRFLANSTSKLSVRLTKIFSLGVGFQVKYDSAPAPGRVKTDTALSVGLDAVF